METYGTTPNGNSPYATAGYARIALHNMGYDKKQIDAIVEAIMDAQQHYSPAEAFHAHTYAEFEGCGIPSSEPFPTHNGAVTAP